MQVDINQTHRDGLTQCTFTSDTGHNDKIESSLRVVWRTEPGSCCNLGICFYLYQSADIELNPGPVSFTLCTLNIHSILHPLHSAALCDLIDTHNPDLFCLTETWIKPTTTSSSIAQRWKTSLMNCCTYPGADCHTDHQLLVTTAKSQTG